MSLQSTKGRHRVLQKRPDSPTFMQRGDIPDVVSPHRRNFSDARAIAQPEKTGHERCLHHKSL